MAKELDMEGYNLKIAEISDFPTILDAVACSVCGKLPPPTAPVCDFGHVTCFECFDTNSHCKFEFNAPRKYKNWNPRKCQRPLQGGFCFPYSLIYDGAELWCPAQVCEKAIRGKNMARHGKTCLGIDSVPCVFTDCPSDEDFTLWNIVQHLKDDHHVPVVGTGPRETGMYRYTLKQKYFSDDGQSHVPVIVHYGGNDYIVVCSKEKVDSEECYVVSVYSTLVAMGIKDEPRVIFGSLAFNCESGDTTDWNGTIPTLRQRFKSDNTVNPKYHCVTFPITSGLGGVRSLDIEINEMTEEDADQIQQCKGWTPMGLPEGPSDKDEDSEDEGEGDADALGFWGRRADGSAVYSKR